MPSIKYMPNKEIRSDNTERKNKGNSSVINSAVFQVLRYEHSGDSHEAEVSIGRSVWDVLILCLRKLVVTYSIVHLQPSLESTKASMPDE